MVELQLFLYFTHIKQNGIYTYNVAFPAFCLFKCLAGKTVILGSNVPKKSRRWNKKSSSYRVVICQKNEAKRSKTYIVQLGLGTTFEWPPKKHGSQLWVIRPRMEKNLDNHLIFFLREEVVHPPNTLRTTLSDLSHLGWGWS